MVVGGLEIVLYSRVPNTVIRDKLIEAEELQIILATPLLPALGFAELPRVNSETSCLDGAEEHCM